MASAEVELPARSAEQQAEVAKQQVERFRQCESLLNDGSSVVLFTFIMSLVRAGYGVSNYADDIPWTGHPLLELLRSSC